MAKFCTKCGKKLEEGQECTCSKDSASKSTTSASSIDFKECGTDCLNLVKGVFVKPFETVKEFAQDSKLISAIIMIVIAALASGILVMATNASIASQFYKPNYLKLFFNDFFKELVNYAVTVAAGYALIAFLFKGKTTWKQMTAIVGIAVAPIIVGQLINSVLVFVDADIIGNLMGYINVFSVYYSVVLLYKGVEETAELDKNKLMLGVASIYVAVAIAMDIYAKIVK